MHGHSSARSAADPVAPAGNQKTRTEVLISSFGWWVFSPRTALVCTRDVARMSRTVNSACHLENMQRLPLPTKVTIEAVLQSLGVLRTSFACRE